MGCLGRGGGEGSAKTEAWGSRPQKLLLRNVPPWVPRELVLALPSGDADLPGAEDRRSPPPAEPLPSRAALGLWESFSGRPHPSQGCGEPGLVHHLLLGRNIHGWAQSPSGAGEGKEGGWPSPWGIFSSPALDGSQK